MRISTSAIILSGLAAHQVVATWDVHAPKFNSPYTNNNECSEKQKGGYNWADLPEGPARGYDNFNFGGGWSCSKSFGKRDHLTKRTFNSKCVKNKVNKRTPATFDCGDKLKNGFSVKEMQVSLEYDAHLEFHYGMQDGSVCKQTVPCKKDGTVVKNTQCGGAKSVQVYLGKHDKGDREDCEVGLHHIDFDCNPPVPPKTKTKKVETSTSKTPETSKPPPYTTAPESSKPPPYTSAPESSKPPPYTSAPESSKPPPYTSAPESKSTSETKGYVSTPTTKPSETTPLPSSTPKPPPGYNTYPDTKPYLNSTAPATSKPGSTKPVVTPPTYETPSETPKETPSETPKETPKETPSETPKETPKETPSETPKETPSETPKETPKETPSTTPKETPYETPKETPSVTPSSVPMTTSTIYSTSTATITSCAQAVTNCPANEASTVVVTSVIAVSTTVCPVSEVNTPPPASSTPAPPPAGPGAPPVLPKCMNTWLDIESECNDNADYSCYCKNPSFTKDVIECVTAWGGDEIDAALSYLAGICAQFIPQNPGIITDCPPTVTLSPPKPAPPAPSAPGVTAVPPTAAPAVPATTIVYQTTLTVPCSTSGTLIPGSSTVTTISTVVTVPQVVFEQPKTTPVGATAVPVQLVPGTPPPVTAVPTAAPPVYTTSTFAVVPTGNATTSSPAIFTGAASSVNMNSVAPALFGAVLAFFAL